MSTSATEEPNPAEQRTSSAAAAAVAAEPPVSGLRFVLPALIGATIFLGPVITEDRQTVVFGLVTDGFKVLLGAGINEALLLVVGIAALGALLCKLIAPTGDPDTLISQVFRTSWLWVLLRLFGLTVVACVYFEVGPSWLRLPDTGITAVKDIGQNVLVIYFGGLLLMPLLTEYGLMEFAGTLCRPLFRRLFRLPGRAAVDTLTSIAAAAAIGLLVTISQYRRGYYNAREACIIACNFSLVAIPFSLLLAEVARIEHLFFGWYLSMLFACILCAMVLARIPPLSRIPATVAPGTAVPPDADRGGLRTAWNAALARAATGPGPGTYLRDALRSFAVNAGGVIGPSIGIATLASLLLFHSPVVTGLATPISAVLSGFSVTDAGIVASGMIIGFGDQFLPALVAARLDSELWRFVLAGLSVTQIIFMSEFGLLILRSPLPITLLQLLWLFVLRTVITLPVLLLFGMLLTS